MCRLSRLPFGGGRMWACLYATRARLSLGGFVLLSLGLHSVYPISTPIPVLLPIRYQLSFIHSHA